MLVDVSLLATLVVLKTLEDGTVDIRCPGGARSVLIWRTGSAPFCLGPLVVEAPIGPKPTPTADVGPEEADPDPNAVELGVRASGVDPE